MPYGGFDVYIVLKEKAHAFRQDPEVQALLAEYYRGDDKALALLGPYSRAKAEALKRADIPLDALRRRGYALERLDQLAVEHLLGVRG
ncbi:hypothetical protein Thermus77420_21260 [Thermus thalpophilus]